ncbi:DUF423 domain-containing protein [Enterobacteriaceae bacterium LUAb1]
MSSRVMLIFAAVSGCIYVAFGAFGAHVLSKTLGTTEMMWIKTGLEYQCVHTLAILGIAAVMLKCPSRWFGWSSVFLALGTILFSGSLYCLAFSPVKIWAYITPAGGVCFLAGWILMLTGALRLTKQGQYNE